MLLPPEKIYVAKSGFRKAGRGVYANMNIKQGERIERCPVIEIPKKDFSNYKENILAKYYFQYGANDESWAIALGFGSIYNHSYHPNAFFKKNSQAKIIDFFALKDIKKDEEVTVNYWPTRGKTPVDKRATQSVNAVGERVPNSTYEVETWLLWQAWQRVGLAEASPKPL